MSNKKQKKLCTCETFEDLLGGDFKGSPAMFEITVFKETCPVHGKDNPSFAGTIGEKRP